MDSIVCHYGLGVALKHIMFRELGVIDKSISIAVISFENSKKYGIRIRLSTEMQTIDHPGICDLGAFNGSFQICCCHHSAVQSLLLYVVRSRLQAVDYFSSVIDLIKSWVHSLGFRRHYS